MSQAASLPSLPPPLPRVARFRPAGIAAFFFAAASSGTAGLAIVLWRDLARYVEGRPPSTIAGGVAFSLNFVPFATSFVAILLGIVGSLVFLVSCGLARQMNQSLFTGLHVITALLLFPSFFFLACFVARIIPI
ncbi:MAG: hypothetical protein ABMA13_17150 [Chthoniobacteraceae bacterium]